MAANVTAARLPFGNSLTDERPQTQSTQERRSADANAAMRLLGRPHGPKCRGKVRIHPVATFPPQPRWSTGERSKALQGEALIHLLAANSQS
jgi:hypothetical protein